VQPGGRDARRFANWVAAGLEVRDASPGALQDVRNMSQKAGNLSRLSEADLSLAALALDLEAVLVTDDYTLLDVAKRLGLKTQTVNTQGIEGTLDFQPRCTGCGRWFDAMPKREECTVCGSPVKPKPKPKPAQ
jgi:endoribonuclease Nob1